jgi:hypothetical protein
VAKFQRFEGFWATPRGIAMLKEARRIFTARTGRKPPSLSQGGLSTGVSASAGTHAREAFDSRTGGWSAHYQREWEIAMWTVGFGTGTATTSPACGRNTTTPSPKVATCPVLPAHKRAPSATAATDCAGNRPYTAIGNYAGVTWEAYQASKKGPRSRSETPGTQTSARCRCRCCVKVWRSGSLSRNAWYVQWWLRDLEPVQGTRRRPGRAQDESRLRCVPVTRVLKLKGKDATGDPGFQSLSALRARAKTHKKPVAR